jgi:hypothetical protein
LLGVEWRRALVGNLIRRRERAERDGAAVHQFLIYTHKSRRNKRRKKEEKNNCQSTGNAKRKREKNSKTEIKERRADASA